MLFGAVSELFSLFWWWAAKEDVVSKEIRINIFLKQSNDYHIFLREWKYEIDARIFVFLLSFSIVGTNNNNTTTYVLIFKNS